MNGVLPWAGFVAFILGMLVLDLKVLQRDEHEIQIREALLWTLFWIGLSLLFNAGILLFEGREKALEFLTGYLIEKSLSVDNIFIFVLIFSYFKVPSKFQHKVLFWGILGALVMRAAFIFAGVALLTSLHWLIYLFGVFLVYVGIRMAFGREKEIHPERSPVLRLVRRILPVAADDGGDRFFKREGGRLFVTSLFIVLIVIETTDVVFAVDSIPAILSITRDPFIVFTSNVFAILGLRALYFAIAGIMRLFTYLHFGLSAILVFVGAKMLLSHFFEIPAAVALGVIAGVLLLSILASIAFPRQSALPDEDRRTP